MISLNEKWINGMSYKEILDLAVSKGEDGSTFVEEMRDEAISKVAYFSPLHEGKKKSFIYDEEMIQSYIDDTFHLFEFDQFNQETLDYLKKTLTREIIVVIVSLSVIEEERLLPSGIYFNFVNAVNPQLSADTPQLPKNVRFTALFDYVPYVIQFSSFTNEQLWMLFDYD